MIIAMMVEEKLILGESFTLPVIKMGEQNWAVKVNNCNGDFSMGLQWILPEHPWTTEYWGET